METHIETIDNEAKKQYPYSYFCHDEKLIKAQRRAFQQGALWALNNISNGKE